MADFMGNKKRLTINLSLFAPTDQTTHNSSTKPPTKIKSPKSFEPNGVVGLGIVAALNELDQTHHHFLSPKPCRAAISAVSPRSTPIPIGAVGFSSASAKFGVAAAKSGGGGPGTEVGMELSEEYTCVISHIGNNMVTKREYFDSTKLSSAEAGSLRRDVAAAMMETAAFQNEGFLSSCYLCKKKLKGLDIFMYRGEKAFCSADCRCKQISIDERKEKEKCGSGVMNPMEYSYSVSPCSGPMQFFAGVAAA